MSQSQIKFNMQQSVEDVAAHHIRTLVEHKQEITNVKPAVKINFTENLPM